ncbi:MAG: hypothetical protein IJH87_04115, partial [Atopobiaceae bacterium]|nr:hypothetical protein [Atopobiaceae bacterium]
LSGVVGNKTIAKSATGDALKVTWEGLPAYANIKQNGDMAGTTADESDLNDMWLYYQVVEEPIANVTTRYNTEPYVSGDKQENLDKYSADPKHTEAEKDEDSYLAPDNRVKDLYVTNFPNDVSGTARFAVVKQFVGKVWEDEEFTFKVEPKESKLGDEESFTLNAERTKKMPMAFEGGNSTAKANTDTIKVSDNEHGAFFNRLTIKRSDLGYDESDATMKGEFIYEISEVVPDGAVEITDPATNKKYWAVRNADGHMVKYTQDTHLVKIVAKDDGNGSISTVVSFDDRETGEVRDLVMDMISDKGQRGVSLRSDWVIYDVRCSDSAFAWVELNMLTRDWKLYGQTMSDGYPTGEPALLWEADAEYDPPAMCFSGNKLVWQVMPALSGSKTTEHSFAYLWEAGTKVSTAVVESPGRFASEPAASGSTVTLAPRVNADSGVFYGITAYSIKDDFGTVVDQLVLPSPIKPFRAVRIGENFVFSVEATYQSGGLFQNMGTFIGPSEGPFIWLSREPSADVCGNGHGTYVIKSRASYFIVNVHRKNFAILASAKDSVDYGDYPASVGRVGTFCTFATVKNADTGQPQEVLFRAYKI